MNNIIKLIKSVFNYSVILSSFIGSIGYGIGYSLSLLYGFHPIICIIFSMILGMPFDFLAEKLLANETITGSRKRKVIFALIVYSVYFIAWFYVNKYLLYDLDYDFLANILLIFIFQLVSLIMNHFRKYIKRKVQSKINVKKKN